MTWRIARSLGATARQGLLGEINASAPDRLTVSDGSIGDAAHSARTSDHNPCDCHRVVCARDFMHDPAGGFDAHAFAEWLARRVTDEEPRVKYIISNRRICSGQGQSYPPGIWRLYSGSNPHTKHVHVSVRHPNSLFDATDSWGWSGDAVAPPPPKPPALADPALPIPIELPAEPPAFPLMAGHWFGPEDADARNHPGFWATDRPWIRYCVLLLKQRGWSFVVDDDHYQHHFAQQVVSFQRWAGISDDGLIGPETFAALHRYVGQESAAA